MVKLICYNVEYCKGNEGLWYQYLQFWKVFRRPKKLDQKILEKLKPIDPDIVALIEVDTGSFRAHKDDVVFFEKGLHMKSFVEKMQYPFISWIKLFSYIPLMNQHSNGAISKYQFEDVKYHELSSGVKRIVVEATVRCPKPITLLIAHLSLGKGSRTKQIKDLIKIINKCKHPVILMGDLNTVHGTGEMESLLQKTHLNDKFKINPFSLRKTFPTWSPNRRLDYILTSQKIKVKDYRVLDFHFSDHRPLFIEFDVK
ncbi:hypothetical protein HN587_01530 [Candidatus Woesearchaeota archaeon]|jgi:endonuclease/exonuclease/phosphatase family metal-dependent hydrolase|nr:hypothetical protein [Candidatus Woesearchaeota archaeon]